MTREKLRERLRREVAEESYRRVGKRYGVSGAYVHRVCTSSTPLSDEMAERMGYRRVEVFEPVEPRANG